MPGKTLTIASSGSLPALPVRATSPRCVECLPSPIGKGEISLSFHTSHGAARKTIAILASRGLLTGGIAAATAAPATAADRPASTQRRSTALRRRSHPSRRRTPARATSSASRTAERLTSARRSGDRTVTIMIVTKKAPGQRGSRSTIRAAGGYVRYRRPRSSTTSAPWSRPRRSRSPLSSRPCGPSTSTRTLKIPENGGHAVGGATDVLRSRCLDAGRQPLHADPGHRVDRVQGRGTRRGTAAASPSASSTRGIDLDAPRAHDHDPGRGEDASTGSPRPTPSPRATSSPAVTPPGCRWSKTRPARRSRRPARTAAPSGLCPATGSYKIRTVDEAKTDLAGCELCGDAQP